LLVGGWEERGRVERHVGVVVLRVADRLIRIYDTKMVWYSRFVQSGGLLYIDTIKPLINGHWLSWASTKVV
jgi:hypothetical protein